MARVQGRPNNKRIKVIIMLTDPIFTEADFKKVRVKCLISICERKATRHQVCHKHLVLKKRYQLTLKRLETLCTTPCQICGDTKDLHIDHDTDCCALSYLTCGNCIKGVVCKNCNNILTLSSFKVDKLEKAINYLKSRE